MTPYYETECGKLYHGHVLDVLKAFPDRSVNCCVTSPPYWGLRDYEVPPRCGAAIPVARTISGPGRSILKSARTTGPRPSTAAAKCRARRLNSGNRCGRPPNADFAGSVAPGWAATGSNRRQGCLSNTKF